MKILIAVVVLMVAGAVTAQQTNRLDTYRQSCEQQEQVILATYGKALEAATATAKRQGDLDSVLELQSERKRFNAERTVPPPSGAKGSYRRASEAYYTAMATLLNKYVMALDGLVKAETAADRIEEAKTVKAEKTRAEFNLADIETRLPMNGQAIPNSKATSPAEREIELPVTLGEVQGDVRREGDHLTYWHNVNVKVAWTNQEVLAGTYEIYATYACRNDRGGCFKVVIGDESLDGNALPTGGTWGIFEKRLLGMITLAKPATTVHVSTVSINDQYLWMLRNIILKRVK